MRWIGRRRCLAGTWLRTRWSRAPTRANTPNPVNWKSSPNGSVLSPPFLIPPNLQFAYPFGQRHHLWIPRPRPSSLNRFPSNRVLPDFTGFYWVLPGFTGFYRVLLGFIGFYRVLLGCIFSDFFVEMFPFLKNSVFGCRVGPSLLLLFLRNAFHFEWFYEPPAGLMESEHTL